MGIRSVFELAVKIQLCYTGKVGRDSVVRTATRYGLDGPGIESWSRSRPGRPLGLHSLLYNVYQVSFPGGKATVAWR
jgi:hypothetical protein